MPTIAIEDLGIRFGAYNVLEALNLTIADGEFIVLLGPSGCGKSTLLNAIAGLIETNSGHIRIDGRDVTGLEPKDRGIAMVFQSYALYPRMSVRGNLSFGLKVAKLPRAEIDRRVAEAAAMLQIDKLLERKPSELSGGQRQRVAIGRALVRQTGIYLFDEPLSNLDAQLRAELRHEIKRLHGTLGATMVYVTHDQIEALTLADRVAVLKGGLIQQLDSPRVVYDRPANRYVAGFVGSPAMTFLPARLTTSGGAAALIDGQRIELAGYDFATPPQDGLAVEIGVRPEHPVLNGGGLPTLVEMTEPMGADTLLWCSLGAVSVTVRVDAQSPIRTGDRPTIHFPADRLSVFDTESGRRL